MALYNTRWISLKCGGTYSWVLVGHLLTQPSKGLYHMVLMLCFFEKPEKARQDLG